MNYFDKMKCSIDPSARIGKGTVIHDFVYIGKNVIIGKNCMMANFVDINSDVKIGDETRIQSLVSIPTGTMIGSRCRIASLADFANEMYPPHNRKYWKPVIVEDNCIIGMGTLIRAGVRVGKNSVIGMGSLVVRDVPSNSVVFGVPAKGKRGYTRSVYEKKKIDYERKLIGASI